MEGLTYFIERVHSIGEDAGLLGDGDDEDDIMDGFEDDLDFS